MGSSAASGGGAAARGGDAGDSSNAKGTPTESISSDTLDLDNGPNRMEPASHDESVAVDQADLDNGPNRMEPASATEAVAIDSADLDNGQSQMQPASANVKQNLPETPLEEDPFKQPLAQAPDDPNIQTQHGLSAAVAAISSTSDSLTSQDYAMEQLTTWANTMNDDQALGSDEDLAELDSVQYDLNGDSTDMSTPTLDDFDLGDD